MGLFAIGNILLKYKRDRLPRDEKVSWISVLLGLGFMIAGAYLFAIILIYENIHLYIYI
jgi:Na+/H+ antiporter NhaB